MDLFARAAIVRLRSHHDKYLVAEDNQEGVYQDKNGSTRAARWTVEIVEGSAALRLNSCYGKYLTASNVPFLIGGSGRKVLQTRPRRLDSSLEWEPVREGVQVKLRTRYGNFLRGNGGLPPWRNSVTHDGLPHRASAQSWILWDVDVLEVRPMPDEDEIPDPPRAVQRVDEGNVGLVSPLRMSSSAASGRLSTQESLESLPDSPPRQDGRMIRYYIADDQGKFDEGIDNSFIFKGLNVVELAEKLKEETGLDDIIICTKSPLNGNLYPLRLQLPPNNAPMNIIVVPSTSKVAMSF